MEAVVPPAALDLAALLAAASTAPQGLSALSPGPCAQALELDGVTVSLFNRSGLELIWYDPADAAGIALEDLQYTLGEGPSWDAAHTGEPVTVPDLQAAAEHRRPALLAALHGEPARGVVALPLWLGAIRMGALTGHRAAPGHLTRPQMANALTLAEAAVLQLLRPSGSRGLGSHRQYPLHRAVIHQASGALAVRLGLPIDQALARLRAYAFTHERPILDVAHDIVQSRFDLDDSPT